MLNIIPIKDDGITSCYDVLLESIGNWKACGFELMYLDNWKFLFKEEGTKGVGIWERGIIAPRLYFDDLLKTNYLIDKFHGINIEFKKVELNNLENTFDEILKENIPILLFIDTYYLPWMENFYGSIHSTHTILIVGKNENGDYYCNDTRPYLQEPIAGGLLSTDEMIKGYAGWIGRINFNIPNYSYEDVYTYLKNIDYNIFSSIREFGDYIKKNNINLSDVEDFGGGNGILLRAIRNIIRSRVHFQKSLTYLNNKYSRICLDRVIYDFNTIISKWNLVKVLIYKAYIKRNLSCFNVRLSEIIYEISYLEEEAAMKLNEELEK